MNSTQGIPGETNFRCKLPKYITKASLSLAVFHLRQSYESLNKDITIDECDFISQTLSRILPSLHVDICKHFALTSCLISDHVHVYTDGDDDSERHSECPGPNESVNEAQSGSTIVNECEGDKQCIWCSNMTGSDNEKALCKNCVAIPERIGALENRFQERFGGSNNNQTQGALVSEPNSNAPLNDPTARVKDQSSDAFVNADMGNTKLIECQNELLSLKQLVTNLTNNVQQINQKLEKVSHKKQDNQTVVPPGSPTPQADDANPIRNRQNTDDNQLSDMEVNTPTASNSCPSTEQQLQDYKDKHRSKFVSKPVITPSSTPTKVDVLIIGDSMTRTLIPSKLSSRKRVKCKTLPGAKIEDAFDTAHSLAQKLEPDEMILHLGTNNVTQDDKEEIVAKLISLADQITMQTSAKSITLSTIIHRAYETDEISAKVTDINEALKLLANQRHWSVINNDSIVSGLHLVADGVHLNEHGTRVFARNVITHLREPSSVTSDRPSTNHSPNQRPRSPRTMECAPPPQQETSYASAASSRPSFRSYRPKFRKKPKGRVFPRDWLDCLQTAHTLLNQGN